MQTRSHRRGYTLFEVMLVCAVLVLVAAISYPTLRGMYPAYKLQGGVDTVRAAWANARARAIEEGRPYRFAVDDQGSHCRIAPDRQDYWSGGAGPADDPDGRGMVLEMALPAGVRLQVNDGPAPELPNEYTDQEENPSSGNWSTAAIFLPDGTAKQDVRIVCQTKGARATAIQLRALTGTVSVQTVNP